MQGPGRAAVRQRGPLRAVGCRQGDDGREPPGRPAAVEGRRDRKDDRTAAAAGGPAAVHGWCARPAEREAQDQVTVRMPAEGAYLSVLRTATAGLAARLDFTLDEIEDLRIAVDEACAMLLSQAVPGSNLECGFTLGEDRMTIAVSVLCLRSGAAGQRHLRLDGAVRAGRKRGRVGRARRQGHDRCCGRPRVVGVSVTGKSRSL